MKVTPTYDLSWWLKWMATFCILSSTLLRAVDDESLYKHVDFILGFVGTIGWLAVGLMWKDRAMIVLNTTLAVVISLGLLNLYI
jgi:hypothetical protein